jgi:hypothetical protein
MTERIFGPTPDPDVPEVEDANDPVAAEVDEALEEAEDTEDLEEEYEEDEDDDEEEEEPPEGDLEGTNEVEEEQEESADPASPDKVKVKINDEEREVSLDDLVRTYQKERAATEKFLRAKELNEAVSAKIDEVFSSDDPLQGYANLLSQKYGEDKAAEMLHQSIMNRFNQHVEEAQLSPEEQENRRLKRENEALRKRQEKRQQDEETAKKSKEEAQALKDFRDQVFTEAKESGLPQNALILQRVAIEMQNSIRNGEEISVKEAIGIVGPQYRQELIASLDGVSIKDLPRS